MEKMRVTDVTISLYEFWMTARDSMKYLHKHHTHVQIET